MKSLKISLIGVLVLGAFLSFSAPASADHIIDTSCDGNPYPNYFRVFDFYAATPDSDLSGDASSLISGGVACGTILHTPFMDPPYFHGCGPSGQEPPQGLESLNVRVEVNLPAGVKVNSTDNLPEGAYAGLAVGNAAICDLSQPGSPNTQIMSGSSIIRIQHDRTNTDCPPEAVSCYKATAGYQGYTGWSYSWIMEEADGSFTLITGRPYHTAPGDVRGGFTQFGVVLCAYAGSPDGEECGDESSPDMWLQKNGDPSDPYCDNGNGIATITVTNYRGDQTDPVSDCVEWRNPVDPDCDGEPYDNALAIHEFDFRTETPWASEVSGIGLSGLYCGTRIFGDPPIYGPPEGVDTLADRVDVSIPASANIEINDDQGGTIPLQSYVGSAQVRVATWIVGEGEHFLEPEPAVIRKVENSPGPDDDCPDEAITCYKATFTGDFFGFNYNWVTPANNGGYTLSIGPFHNTAYGEYPAGVTRIEEIAICGFAGSPDSDECGDSSDSDMWLQRNGDTSLDDCNGDDPEDSFTITATDKGDRTTDPETTCVAWEQIDTTITSVPDDPSPLGGAATFEFESNVEGSKFECKLDDEAWEDCDSPKDYESLSGGQHTFSVRATGTLGDNPDPTPAEHTWTVLSIFTDPVCEESYGSGAYGLFDFDIDTPDSGTEHEVSSVTGEFAACPGMLINWSPDGGYEDAIGWLYRRFDIETPRGVEVNSTSELPDAAYAGSLSVNVMSWEGSIDNPVSVPGIELELKVDESSQDRDCPVEAIACYRADPVPTEPPASLSGHLWIWVVENDENSIYTYTVTIGEFHNDTNTGVPAGITKVSGLEFCGYAGEVGDNICGNADDNPDGWLQRNGDASVIPEFDPYRSFVVSLAGLKMSNSCFRPEPPPDIGNLNRSRGGDSSGRSHDWSIHIQNRRKLRFKLRRITPRYNGWYRLTATTWFGSRTPPVETCVEWRR